ncbi:MAG: hypothetical protein JWP95_1037 [Actinotalea sp.]|nr:hypothetical protein [Actinotalea sp.]
MDRSPGPGTEAVLQVPLGADAGPVRAHSGALPIPAGSGPLVIQNEHWRVGVLPGTGASLAFGQTRLPDGRWYDVLRPTRPAGLKTYAHCASYVLVPFSNRVRDGLLRFGDRSWQLRRNAADGTAMHGAGHEFDWTVVACTAEAVTLAFRSGRVTGANFPWSFDAEVTYALDGPRLTVSTVLTSTDVEAFPAGFGHHPFFQRGIVDPELSEVLVELPSTQSHPMVAGMAVGAPRPVPPLADYTRLRRLERPFVDICLTGRRGADPVRMEWPVSGVALSLHADRIYGHTVFYVPRARSYFAVEPVTHANDGFNLMADGVEGHGVFVLEPGESRSGAFHLDIEPLERPA